MAVSGPSPRTASGPRRTLSFLLARSPVRRPARPSLAPDAPAGREEGRSYDWGYCRPVVTVDVVWNAAFVVIAAAVLASTARERPSVPLRVWVLVYALQCLVHVGFVCVEFTRRRRRRVRMARRRRGDSWTARIGGEDEDEDEDGEEDDDQGESRTMKKMESLNATISMLWWLLGFYWVAVGGNALLQDAPRLYWLTIVFLAFDVFFAIFCVILACTIGIALCCCLPCILAYFNPSTEEEDSSDYLSHLPKFRYRQLSHLDNLDLEKGHGAAMKINDKNSIADLTLPPDDTECCICLSQYEDGTELHSLPCSHHFHSSCIMKWLRISATCPLCKYNVLGDDEHV